MMRNAGKMFMVLVMAAVLLPNAFAGGGSQQGGASGASLKLGIWDKNQEQGITDVLKDFTAETGIKVDVEVTPWDQYWTLLEASASGGSLPDVFWMHSNMAQRYGTNGMLMDLTPRIAKSNVADLSKFPKDLVGLYTFSGKNYAIPKDLDTIALWYNKTMFDAAGIAYPDNTWTWDTLKDTAKKLTSGNQYGFACHAGEPQSQWGNFIYQNGGYMINDAKNKSGFDDPKTIAALEYFVNFVKDGSSPGLAITGENGAPALFESGTVAMAFFGSWMLSEFKANEYVAKNCDLAVLPSGAGGKRATLYNGLGWVASANTKQPEEAWKLLEFLSREDTQKKLSTTGIAISAYTGAADTWITSSKLFNLKAYTEQIPYAVFRPYSKNTIAWEDMAVQKLNDALSGAKSVSAVCQDIAQNMNQALAKE
jgi:multiple sugar transport system substrate-binding protein